MLRARHRMRHSDDFARAIRSGSRAPGRYLVVHLMLSAAASGQEHDDPTSAPAAQVGFVVSKAVGGAVQRNLVKRRLRSLMSTVATDLPSGCYAVVRALPAAANAGYAELSEELTRSLGVATQRQRRTASQQGSTR